MDPTYTGSYGRIKAYGTEFLSDDTFRRLLNAKNPDEIASELFSTFYRSDMELFSGVYKGIDLVNMSINHRLIVRNRIALFAAPVPARDVIRAYLSKWDISNIKSVISSKYLGYGIKETESFLVSFRDVPIGLFGGNLTKDDYNALLSQSGIENLVNYLSNFGYGQQLLLNMDRFRKSGDVSILMATLDTFYYSRLVESIKFYNGDEAPLRSFVAEEIDLRNIMVVLKGLDLGIEFERIKEGLIPSGSMDTGRLQDLFATGGVEQAVEKLRSYGYMDAPIKSYLESRRLESLESAIRSSIFRKYLDIFSSQALSVGSTFAFILRSEHERERIRSVSLGKYYSISEERIRALVI